MSDAVSLLPRIPAPHSRPIPFRQAAVRAGFRWWGRWLPTLCADVAAKWFRSPRRRRMSSRLTRWLVGSDQIWVPTPTGTVATYVWPYGGETPWEGQRARGTVLLVHGWEGCAAQMGAFVEPLRAAGYRVVAFDAPAHGRSSGSQTDGLEFAEAIEAVARHVGGVDTIIAHSLGVPCVAVALRRGVHTQRAVFISGPCRFEAMMSKFVAELDLPPPAEHVFRRRVAERYGADVWERLDVTSEVPRGAPETLVVHDVDDTRVDFAEARVLANAWPNTRLVATAGLGHTRVLHDPMVLDTVRNFVVDPPAHASA